MERCPRCSGNGQVFCAIDYADRPGEMGYRQCTTCEGAGSITEEYAGRIRKGKDARDARVARGETLRACAYRMGITPVLLSRMEQGVAPPPPEWNT